MENLSPSACPRREEDSNILIYWPRFRGADGFVFLPKGKWNIRPLLYAQESAAENAPLGAAGVVRQPCGGGHRLAFRSHLWPLFVTRLIRTLPTSLLGVNRLIHHRATPLGESQHIPPGAA